MNKNTKLYVMTNTQFQILENWKEFLHLVDEGKELSPKQKAYQALMLFGLSKFGVETPADLSDEKKSEFFNWISDNWDKGKGKVKDPDVQKEIEAAKEKGDIKDPAELQK